MRNPVLLIVLFLLSSLLLAAQTANPSPDTNQSANLPWDMTAITGCLQSSMGHYTLTEDDGTKHELTGAAGKLKHQVDHEIEVVGKKATRSVDSTSAGGASTVVEHPVFEVKSVKRVADKCTSPGE